MRPRANTGIATEKCVGSGVKVISDLINWLLVNGSNRGDTDPAFHDGWAATTEIDDYKTTKCCIPEIFSDNTLDNPYTESNPHELVLPLRHEGLRSRKRRSHIRITTTLLIVQESRNTNSHNS